MMTHYVVPTLLAACTAVLITAVDATAAPQAAAASDTPAVVEVQSGTAAFDADTNISAITVHGKSSNVQGRAQIRRTSATLAIDQLEATLPVKTITTGMGLRDEHMRKYIFTTADGQVPDLRFVSDKAECAAWSSGASNCKVSGQLAIRGLPRPLAIALTVNQNGDTYRVAGEATVKLSTYGIPQPSQLGVTATDDVKLHLEFTARPAARLTAARAGDTR